MRLLLCFIGRAPHTGRGHAQEPNQEPSPKTCQRCSGNAALLLLLRVGRRARGRARRGEGGGCNRRNGRPVASPQLVLAVAGGTLKGEDPGEEGGGRKGGRAKANEIRAKEKTRSVSRRRRGGNRRRLAGDLC